MSVVSAEMRAQRDARIRAAWALTQDSVALAARFKLSTRHIQRVVAPIRDPESIKRASTEGIAWALAAVAEGMPASWAAETVGAHYETIREKARALPRRAENMREWASVWQQIRQSERMYEYHREFMPRTMSAKA